jgi:ABC-type sugar transport system ATPase subunit
MAERVEPEKTDFFLEMKGVSKRFGATVALEDVGIKVAAGEVLALVGETARAKAH